MQVTRQSRRKTVQAQATPQQRKTVQNMSRMQVSPVVKKKTPYKMQKTPSQSLGRQMLNIKK